MIGRTIQDLSSYLEKRYPKDEFVITETIMNNSRHIPPGMFKTSEINIRIRIQPKPPKPSLFSRVVSFLRGKR